MAHYLENLEPELAQEVELLSQLIFELRQNRNAVLASHDAADDAALLQRIEDGSVAEHPAYEHYLAARILADTCETVRSLVAERLQEGQRR